jgi:hypothetical protein
MPTTRFAFPTDIRFGAGVVRAELAGHLRERRLARPLVVTDAALAELPLASDFLDLLAPFACATFAGARGNPTDGQVMAGAEAFRAHGADCVIGFGGGAALDVAKLVALMAVHPGDVGEYVFDAPSPRPVEAALPWLVAVPTTAGTGSEVGRSAVISEPRTHVKRVVFDPRLLARAVFADPELTLSLPPSLTAATGMDALTHNIESFLSTAWHPLCDGIALEGLRLGAGALARAVADPADLTARTDMLACSLLGGIAFQKDLGAVHACAHALSAVCDLHHGLANALMIDTVLAWNLPAAAARFERLAAAAGVSGGETFVTWLRQLKAAIGIRGGLAAHGVAAGQLDALAALAARDFAGRTNPRPAGEADYRALFAAAM